MNRPLFALLLRLQVEFGHLPLGKNQFFMSLHWNTDKLNKYLTRIDWAIATGRYSLAMKLTHRLLRQYYRSFIHANEIHPELPPQDNVRHMSISISRYLLHYFQKHKIPYSERRLILITLVSNVIFMATMNLSTRSQSSPVDRALATYARENVYSIISYLMHFIS
jgi:hypothetical protein